MDDGVCVFFENPMSRTEHNDYDNEMVMTEDRTSKNYDFAKNFSNAGWFRSRWLCVDGGGVQRPPLHPRRRHEKQQWDEVQHQVRFET